MDLIRQYMGHLDADELYRRARDIEPRISLSTVYRTLKLFKELGLVEERHLAGERHQYEARGTAEHHHLICLNCGTVIEFESPLIQQLKQAAAETKDFEIAASEIYLSGYCKRCRSRVPIKGAY